MKDIDAVIVAAGMSTRFSGSTKKQFHNPDGRPLICYSIEAFLASQRIKRVAVAVNENDIGLTGGIVNEYFPDACIIITAGGRNRADSVINGLSAVSAERVMIHDGARPGVSAELIERVYAALEGNDTCVIPCIKPADTVRMKKKGSTEVYDREHILLVQTPQCAFREYLLSAMRELTDRGIYLTDEAQYVERAGGRVIVVDGDNENIKVTRMSDIDYFMSIRGRK